MNARGLGVNERSDVRASVFSRPLGVPGCTSEAEQLRAGVKGVPPLQCPAQLASRQDAGISCEATGGRCVRATWRARWPYERSSWRARPSGRCPAPVKSRAFLPG
jgi:hypothetical protein